MSVAAEEGKRLEGRRRKDVALEWHEIENRNFILKARRKLIELLLAGTAVVTIDDLREHITIPASVSALALGSIFGKLAKAEVIRRSGYRESARAVAHGRPVSCWSLQSAALAHKWLADNPAPVNPIGPIVQRTLFGGEG